MQIAVDIPCRSWWFLLMVLLLLLSPIGTWDDCFLILNSFYIYTTLGHEVYHLLYMYSCVRVYVNYVQTVINAHKRESFVIINLILIFRLNRLASPVVKAVSHLSGGREYISFWRTGIYILLEDGNTYTSGGREFKSFWRTEIYILLEDGNLYPSGGREFKSFWRTEIYILLEDGNLNPSGGRKFISIWRTGI